MGGIPPEISGQVASGMTMMIIIINIIILIIKVPSRAKQVNVLSLAMRLTVHRLSVDVGGERVKQKNDLSFSSQLESIHSSRCFPPFRDAGC